MRNTLILTLVALAATTSPSSANQVRYECTMGIRFVARFETNKVVLSIDNASAEITLPQVLSADGGRYADRNTELWIKGRDASFTRGGNTTSCRAN